MVDVSQIVSGIAGFAPAMALLFYTLRGYTFPAVKEPFFDDRKIFAFFALGIVLGMVLFALESWGGTASSNETLVALVLVFALVEEMMKVVILNFPRFQRRLDTGFYGLSMGLGIAATFTFATVYSSLLEVDSPGAFELIAFPLLGLPLVLLHGSTTALIGVGVVRRDLRGYVSEAVLIHLGYSLLMIPFFVLDEPFNILGAIAAGVLTAYSYRRVHTLSLPALIHDAKRLALKKK